MKNGRVIKSIASMLRENFNSETTVVGLDTKVLAGVIFATIVSDGALEKEMRMLRSSSALSERQLDEAVQFAIGARAEPPTTDPKVRAALLVARAASPSPAEITEPVLEACRQSELSSPAIVEIISWLSVLQMLHRLMSYYVNR